MSWLDNAIHVMNWIEIARGLAAGLAVVLVAAAVGVGAMAWMLNHPD
jgi:hypothetical protein